MLYVITNFCPGLRVSEDNAVIRLYWGSLILCFLILFITEFVIEIDKESTLLVHITKNSLILDTSIDFMVQLFIILYTG